MKKVKVKITWFIKKKRIPQVIEESKRKTNLSYAPIIVIKGQYGNDDYIFNPAWSSVVFNESIDGNESIATLTYLVDEAPFELLISGAEFDLYEGDNKVASGIIL